MKEVDCVLLIDDDPITLFIYTSLIEELAVAHEIHSVDNAAAAIEFIRDRCNLKKPITKNSLLIFLDINMPGSDGFEILDELNLQEDISLESAYILILSSSIHQKDVLKAASYNIKGYIQKPLTTEKILEIISDMHAEKQSNKN